jgi:Na+/H+ antiporter NhaA
VSEGEPPVSAFDRRRPDIRAQLAMLYTIGYFATVFISFYVPFPEQNAETIKTLLVLLGTVQAAIIGYYYGASRDTAIRGPSS